jgi:hypothetical protein
MPMRPAPERNLLTTALSLLCVWASLAGCPDDTPEPGAPDGAPVASADLAETPDDGRDPRLDVSPKPQDARGEDILYPGAPCQADEDCSTGLCYGRATPQGAFEPQACQLACLALNDFRHYCDSHSDCCSGRCCLGCGAKEGLCVLPAPGGTP